MSRCWLVVVELRRIRTGSMDGRNPRHRIQPALQDKIARGGEVERKTGSIQSRGFQNDQLLRPLHPDAARDLLAEDAWTEPGHTVFVHPVRNPRAEQATEMTGHFTLALKARKAGDTKGKGPAIFVDHQDTDRSGRFLRRLLWAG